MQQTPGISRKWQSIVLIGITLGGAFLRLLRLNSLPPTAGYDVAQYGVDALQILDGARPIFLSANFGREALFSYLVAFIFWFTGSGSFGIHLASALIGIATIPAVFLAAKELLSAEKAWLRNWGPLLAALVTAVSYWHLNWSRAGLRVIWVPLFAALIVAALWHGLRTGRKIAFVIAGTLLGLSLYTYQAARLLPLLVVAAFVIMAAAQRRFNRRDLANFLLTVGTALLVFAPLGLYAWQNPAIFNDRLRQATLVDEALPVLEQAQTILGQSTNALRMLGIEGDNEPQYTIPGRPSLNPFLFVAFLAGLGLGMWRWKRPSYALLLVWLGLMFLPALVASQAATAKRALGIFPAVTIFIAVGILVPWQFIWDAYLFKKAPKLRAVPALLFGIVVVAGLVLTTAVTYQDYFDSWGSDPGLADHFQRDHTEVGLAIGGLPRDERILVSPFPVSHPAIQLHSRLHPNMRSYNGHFCFIYPGASDSSVTYLIVPGPKEHSLANLSETFPLVKTISGPLRPDTAVPYFDMVRIPAGSEPQLSPPTPKSEVWENQIRLLGFDLLQTTFAPGESIEINLYYQALADVPINYTAFVHLLGAENATADSPIWAQSDSEPCHSDLPTSTWQNGDIIRDTIQLQIAPDIPIGRYELVTGFYTWPDIVRQKVVDPAGSSVGEAVKLAIIQVQ